MNIFTKHVTQLDLMLLKTFNFKHKADYITDLSRTGYP